MSRIDSLGQYEKQAVRTVERHGPAALWICLDAALQAARKALEET